MIFVDDSPLELAEVAAAFPEITCIPFPKNDPASGLALLRRLRDLCGKEEISSDDSLRLESLRQGAEFRRRSSAAASPETFFAGMEAAITIDFPGASANDDARALELVNKTNQFNTNGVRLTAAEWHRRAHDPGAFTLGFSYQDKFGPLGKIAVMQGRVESSIARVDAWVMSCRAFARRIEFQSLKFLFENYAVREIVIPFTPTPKNQPVRDFLTALCGPHADGAFRLTSAQFAENCPALYHHVLVESIAHNG